MANDKSFKIKNGLSATRYLGTNGTETAGSNGPYGTFDTTLYTGTNAAQTITNGVDLSNDGGAVWIKRRDGVGSHAIFDTARGRAYNIQPSGTDPQDTFSSTTGLTSFNSDGFSLGTNNYGSTNQNGATYVSWTFKKASNFFDVVTYTGAAFVDQTVSHNLGSVPGMIIIKCTSSARNWVVYHRSLGNTKHLHLNTTDAESTVNYFNNTDPTDTTFTVEGGDSDVNGYNETYVAYLFAHDTASDGLIQCGSYTGNGLSDGPDINLGWEPQWVMIKSSSLAENWHIFDNVRGVSTGGDDSVLYPNLSSAESTSSNWLSFTSTGFKITATFDQVNSNTNDYIYMAIRNPYIPTITYDTDLEWSGGTAPTAPATGETDVITVSTRDGGTTYQAIQAIDGAK